MKRMIVSSETGTRSIVADYLRKTRDLVDQINELAVSEGSDDIQVIADDIKWYLNECLWYIKQ